MKKAINRTIPVILLAVQLIFGQEDYQMRMGGFTIMNNAATHSEGWWDNGINLVGSLGVPVITNSSGDPTVWHPDSGS